MLEVAFNVLNDGMAVLWDHIVETFEVLFFVKSPSRTYAEMKPTGWYTDQYLTMFEENKTTIRGGHVPLPPEPTHDPVECRYCGRKYPAGTLGSCASCGGVL